MPDSEVSSRVPNMLLSDRQCVLRGNQSSTNHLTYTMWLSLTLTAMSSPVCETSFTAWPTNSRCVFPGTWLQQWKMWTKTTWVRRSDRRSTLGPKSRVMERLNVFNLTALKNCWKGFQDSPMKSPRLSMAQNSGTVEIVFTLVFIRIPQLFPLWKERMPLLQGAGAGGQSSGPQSWK